MSEPWLDGLHNIEARLLRSREIHELEMRAESLLSEVDETTAMAERVRKFGEERRARDVPTEQQRQVAEREAWQQWEAEQRAEAEQLAEDAHVPWRRRPGLGSSKHFQGLPGFFSG